VTTDKMTMPLYGPSNAKALASFSASVRQNVLIGTFSAKPSDCRKFRFPRTWHSNYICVYKRRCVWYFWKKNFTRTSIGRSDQLAVFIHSYYGWPKNITIFVRFNFIKY